MYMGAWGMGCVLLGRAWRDDVGGEGGREKGGAASLRYITPLENGRFNERKDSVPDLNSGACEVVSAGSNYLPT